ncbi:MAG: hypothetical protein RIQ47_510 [Bacteroidota bacterium]|jgi:DNA repair protein RadC
MDKLSVKAWAEEDRPREKLMTSGRHTLTDAELIAILFGSGSRHLSAVELARQVLSSCDNDLQQLARKSAEELMQFKGVGAAKAVSLIAALELGRRKSAAPPTTQLKINGSESAAKLLQEMLGDLHHEEFWVLFLNRANLLIGKQQISKGGMTGTVADPKIIFQQALQHKATSIILSHNHPSGNLKPSDADIRLTKSLVDAGRLLEISVLDHLIITQKEYYSFADEGRI